MDSQTHCKIFHSGGCLATHLTSTNNMLCKTLKGGIKMFFCNSQEKALTLLMQHKNIGLIFLQLTELHIKVCIIRNV